MNESRLKITVLLHVLWVYMLICAAPVQALDFKGGAPSISNLSFQPDSEIRVDLSFSIRHSKTAADFFITFGPGVSGYTAERQLADGSSVLYYNLYRSAVDRTVLKDIADNPSVSEVIADSFAENKTPVTRDYTVTFIIDSNQFPVSSTYSDTVVMSLYEGSPDAPAGLSDTMSITMSVVVGEMTDLALTDPGGSFDISGTSRLLDFGILYSGQQRQADLVIRSNTLYSVSVRSTNGGRMLPSDLSDPSEVPYILSVDGAQVDLASGFDVTLFTGEGPTASSGDRYPMIFTILDYGMATEGLYSDTLVYTLSAP